MMQSGRVSSRHVRNIAVDLVITILTCGIYTLVVQAAQMEAVNSMLKEEKYQFWPWAGLTLITCGLYHMYHEYRKSTDIAEAMAIRFKQPVNQTDALMSVVLTGFGLWVIADAVQQAQINRYFGDNAL